LVSHIDIGDQRKGEGRRNISQRGELRTKKKVLQPAISKARNQGGGGSFDRKVRRPPLNRSSRRDVDSGTKKTKGGRKRGVPLGCRGRVDRAENGLDLGEKGFSGMTIKSRKVAGLENRFKQRRSELKRRIPSQCTMVGGNLPKTKQRQGTR